MRLDFRLGYHLRDMTIGHVLADKATRLGSKTFITNMADGRTLTYEQCHRLSNVLANNFRASGIGKGAHVAIMMENCPEQLLTYFGLGKIGAVAVPINVALRGPLLRYLVEQSDCTSVIVQAHLLPQLLQATSELAALNRIFVQTEPGEAPVTPASGAAQMIDFAPLLHGSDANPDVDVDFRDLAYIMYTSGTTGPSKGVMYPHVRCFLSGGNNAETWGYRYTDICYIALPLFHQNALQGSVYGALITEGSIAIAQRFSASNFWSDIRKSGATMTNLLGSMSSILWGAPPSPDDRNHRLRMCMAIPTPPEPLAFEERFGVRLFSGYGLSDYASTVAFRLTDPVSKLGSAGRSRDGYELRIVDDDDFDVPAGTPGEIVVRSNWRWDTSIGYYKMPEVTLKALRNGWYHTGDRGYLDEDGYLYFVDRSKDSIRRRGENISASEVEQAISLHPAVAGVAVFAVKSEMSDEEVAASVILRAGQELSELDFIEHCQNQMAYFMVPRYVRFVSDLPRTETQKVEKYKLRQAAEKDLSVFWDREKAGVKLRRSTRPAPGSSQKPSGETP